MSKKKSLPKYGQISNSILKRIADLIIENANNTFSYGPRLPYLLALLVKMVIHKNQELNKYQVNRAIRTLNKRNIISLKTINNQVYVSLEENGFRKIAQYSLIKVLKYKLKHKRWNKKWFVVFFDIPESQRNKRAYLRKFLKDIGFYQYQYSVYIFPYQCVDEVKYIRNIVEAEPYTKYMIVDTIENENEIKKYFKL